MAICLPGWTKAWPAREETPMLVSLYKFRGSGVLQ